MEVKKCIFCGMLMRAIPLFTTVYYECDRCDSEEPLDPRGDSDVLPDWNCREYNLKNVVKKFFEAYPVFARLKSEYKVD